MQWIGRNLPTDVYQHAFDKTAIEDDGDEIYWSYEADGYHAYVVDSYG